MDAVLIDRVTARALADVEALRLAARAAARVDAGVVEHEVGAAQPVGRAHGEEIGSPGPAPTRERSPLMRPPRRARQSPQQERPALGHGHTFRPPLLALGPCLHEPAVQVFGEDAFERLPRQAGQGRRFAVAGDGHGHAAAGEDASGVGAAGLRVVDRVHEHAPLLRGGANLAVHFRRGRGHDQPGAVEVGSRKRGARA